MKIFDSLSKVNRIRSNCGSQNNGSIGELLTDESDNGIKLLAVLIKT